MRTRIIVLTALLSVIAGVATAATTGPANDNREDAQAINSLPSSPSGTTAGATTETGELVSGCAATSGSVWYRLDAGKDERVVVNLKANGDLDATVDVYLRERSQVSAITCDKSDKHGDASVAFRAKKNASYLIRVAQLSNSVAGTFKLDVFSPRPAPTPPGTKLPRGGATRTLDRVQNTEDAWAVSLRAGTTYRINESDQIHGCMRLEIIGPNASSFNEGAAKRLGCGGYTLFTPGAGEGGRYSLVVKSSSTARGAQKYHIQVARAAADDTSPGHFVHNFAHTRGKLNGSRIDAVDLYRFDVTTRAAAFISLRTKGSSNFDVALLDGGGRRLACGCDSSTGDEDVHRGLHPGHYYVAVRAYPGGRGSYTLYVAPRTITKSSVTFNGSRKSTISPGSSSGLALHTTPASEGPVTVTIERFDPLSGWLFYKRVHTHESGGEASIGFVPPAVGTYRAHGSYDGTKRSAPSNTGYAYLTVQSALTP